MEQRRDIHTDSVVRETHTHTHTTYKEDTMGNRHTLLAT